MTFALIFPGQGSQSVGMGAELAERFPAARAVFDEVDEALGERLSETIFNGPDDKLTLTANAQPALMAVSMAVVRALESQGFDVGAARFVAGHSLGEYSALAAAGAISIADTARLLRIRGEAMQAAVPSGQGAMSAVLGLESDALEAVCQEAADDEICQIANDNGGGQLVISGSAAAVERAGKLALERGAKRAIPLPVSAPFHCALMEPAARRMEEALGQASILAPRVPVVSNVLAGPIETPDEIRKRLVEQVTGQVRWRESMQFLAAQGVFTLYELGAGKVLSGLARRIDKQLSAQTVGTPAEVEALAGA